ncbi:hypothetical protein B0T26DRAFT_634522 [Lasiosphaeria miniovina]|uniref:Golgi apparatus membrane protein TVP38 n=1 Tax=Lasiosphaeria miniovina TaxID=1954250 RepID=A0AA40BFT8_9PEZI|nr:uncharacterized protein B0T26DRAFT_634522 [Lasiosphaeria miniovina]KAK0733450.1 hypothetical protein B0T26DRAFT_634522 [Lasiosphaeria miniovina]
MSSSPARAPAPIDRIPRGFSQTSSARSSVSDDAALAWAGPGLGAAVGGAPPSPSPRPAAARRLSARPGSTGYSLRRRSHQPDAAGPEQGFFANAFHTGLALALKAWQLFLGLSRWQQVLVLIGGAAVGVMGLVALVFSHRIFAALGPVAEKWRALPGGRLIVWLLCFSTAFPPVIGYSSTVTIAGFVYDFPGGWPIVATATIAGSTTAFLTSRGIFSGYVNRLVGGDRRFVALGQVLRRDGVGVLAMIRLCPLPYSLSNGFLATVPSIRPLSYALATAMTTPKLLIHVFIGSRLARIVESGDKMSGRDRAINYASMAIGALVGFGVGLIIYRRTMARAAELAREVGDEEGGLGATTASETDDEEMLVGPRHHNGSAEYDYDEEAEDDDVHGAESSRLMKTGGALAPGTADAMAKDEDAAALMMDDDDISLWETEAGAGYHDAWDDEAPPAPPAPPASGIGNGIKR